MPSSLRLGVDRGADQGLQRVLECLLDGQQKSSYEQVQKYQAAAMLNFSSAPWFSNIVSNV